MLKLGETGLVKVEIRPSLPQFTGSAKNGVTTHNYPQQPEGA